MKYCNNCNVKLNTNRKTCPLCFDTLKELEESKLNEFPKYVMNVNRQSLWYRILIFICVNLIIAAGVCNYIFYNEFPVFWSLVVGTTIVLFLIFIYLLSHSKKNFASKLLTLVIFSTLNIICVDVVFTTTYKLWSLTYVLPFTPLIGLIITLIITIINSKKYMDYFSVIIIYILLLCLPFVIRLINSNLIYTSWPAITSVAISLSVILGLFIFPRRKTEQEFKKRLHV